LTTNGHGGPTKPTPTAKAREALATLYRDYDRERLLAAVEEAALEKLDEPDALLERAAGMSDHELIELLTGELL
jgi:hypothetical protein